MSHDHPFDPALLRLADRARHGCEESRLMMSRRALLGMGVGLFTWAALPRSAEAAGGNDPRFLLVILRGGMDGLNTVVPTGAGGEHAQYLAWRKNLALSAASTLQLNADFGLNPAMPAFHQMFMAGDAAVVPATAPPLRSRSHFDCLDNLENGLPTLGASTSGWLNRVMQVLPTTSNARIRGALQVSDAPLILRGAAPVMGWSPTWLQALHLETRNRIHGVYKTVDPEMAATLARGIKAKGIAEAVDNDALAQNLNIDTLTKSFMGAARLLNHPTGARIAVLSVDDFDTHSQQGLLPDPADPSSNPFLYRRLKALDDGLAAFRDIMMNGGTWGQTVVLCVTEFGRTVRANGDFGTDHGVATAALLCGGAVKPGFKGGWPGIKAADLYEGSDLKPTCDMRAVFKGVLQQHFDMPKSTLDTVIFPDSAAIAPLANLVDPLAADSMTKAALDGEAATELPPTGIAAYRRRYASNVLPA